MNNKAPAFWSRNLATTPGTELAPGWSFHPVISAFPCDLGMVSMYWCTLEPGCSPHAQHQHEEHELVVVYQGDLEVQHGEEVTPISRFALAYHPPGQAHTLKTTGDQPARFLVMKWQTPADDVACCPTSVFFHVAPPSLPQRGEFNQACEIGQFQLSAKLDLRYQACCFAEGNGFRIHTHTFDVFQMIFIGDIFGLGHRSLAPNASYFAKGVPHGFTRPCPESTYSHAVQVIRRTPLSD